MCGGGHDQLDSRGAHRSVLRTICNTATDTEHCNSARCLPFCQASRRNALSRTRLRSAAETFDRAVDRGISMSAPGSNPNRVGFEANGHDTGDSAAVAVWLQLAQHDASKPRVARPSRSGQSGKDSIFGVGSRLRADRLVTGDFDAQRYPFTGSSAFSFHRSRLRQMARRAGFLLASAFGGKIRVSLDPRRFEAKPTVSG